MSMSINKSNHVTIYIKMFKIQLIWFIYEIAIFLMYLKVKI